MLSDKTLVLCHGHKDRKIQELDYKNTILATISPEDEPDVMVNLFEKLPESLTKYKFPRVIDAFCPIDISYHRSSIKTSFKGGIVDATLKTNYINKIRRLLVDDGLFYIRCSYFIEDEYNNDLLINKMVSFGFEFVRLEDLTFDDSSVEFHVYRKGTVPTLDGLIEFAGELIQTVNVYEIQVKYKTTDVEDFVSVLPEEFEENIDTILNLGNAINYFAVLYNNTTVELIDKFDIKALLKMLK